MSESKPAPVAQRARALKEALELNRADAVSAARGEYEEVSLEV